MKQNLLETIVGAIVLFAAFGCLFVAYQNGSIHHKQAGYRLHANLNNADGLIVGSKVKVSGVEIGQIDEMQFDLNTYKAGIIFTVRDDLKIPIDSSAAIVSSGLLGEKYMSISPGSDTDSIAANGTLQFTQSSINFEELLGKFVFGAANNQSSQVNSSPAIKQ